MVLPEVEKPGGQGSQSICRPVPSSASWKPSPEPNFSPDSNSGLSPRILSIVFRSWHSCSSLLYVNARQCVASWQICLHSLDESAVAKSTGWLLWSFTPWYTPSMTKKRILCLNTCHLPSLSRLTCFFLLRAVTRRACNFSINWAQRAWQTLPLMATFARLYMEQ